MRPQSIGSASKRVNGTLNVNPLLGAGIRIPEELNIVTLVNKTNGSGLTFNVPFTRLEADPIDWGRIVSESVLGYLKDGVFAPDVTIGPKYVRGETF